MEGAKQEKGLKPKVRSGRHIWPDFRRATNKSRIDANAVSRLLLSAMQHLRYILDYIAESDTAVLAGATCAGVLGTLKCNLPNAPGGVPRTRWRPLNPPDFEDPLHIDKES